MLEISVHQQQSSEFEFLAHRREVLSFSIHCSVNFDIEIINKVFLCIFTKAYKIKPNLFHITLNQRYEFESGLPLGIFPSLTEVVLYSLYHFFDCNWFSNDVKRFFIC